MKPGDLRIVTDDGSIFKKGDIFLIVDYAPGSNGVNVDFIHKGLSKRLLTNYIIHVTEPLVEG